MTNIFSTKNTDAAAVKALETAGIEHMKEDGSIEWKSMPPKVRPSDVPGGEFDIKYSRAWLIVRRAFLEQRAPKLLVTLPTVDPAKVPAGSTLKEHTQRTWSKVITPMRDQQNLSWGEIMVRTGQTEGAVRACYRATGSKKDIGTRIGKGGKFAYSDPTLYLAHRKSQGAHIPADLKGRPRVEQLLNAADPATGKVAKPKRAPKAKVAAA